MTRSDELCVEPEGDFLGRLNKDPGVSVNESIIHAHFSSKKKNLSDGKLKTMEATLEENNAKE